MKPHHIPHNERFRLFFGGIFPLGPSEVFFVQDFGHRLFHVFLPPEKIQCILALSLNWELNSGQIVGPTHYDFIGGQATFPGCIMNLLHRNGKGLYPGEAWARLMQVAQIPLQLPAGCFCPSVGLVVVCLGECLTNAQAPAHCCPPGRGKLGSFVTGNHPWHHKK